MKVAILSTSDNKGGADRATYRLHHALVNQKIDISHIVKEKYSEDKSVYTNEISSTSDTTIDTLLNTYYISQNRTKISNTLFTISYGNTLLDEQTLLDADIINLHWIEKFVSLPRLKQIVDLGKPIVWTLHDERPFTGGCHYSAGCTGYTADCYHCIQLEDDPHHLPHHVLQQKIDILKNANVTIVSPSYWLAEEARKSTLFKNFRIEVIPNSIETELFQPILKTEAKEKLGIAHDNIVLMFGAQNNQAMRKGFDKLLEAIDICLQEPAFEEACQNKKITVVLVGGFDKRLKALPMETIEYGYIHDDSKLAEIYSATDIFILPSLEDNLPNTMLEAMSCGTPVVGFDTGGIPDIVLDNKNGLVVKKGDSAALAKGILDLTFDAEKRKRFSLESRKLIVEKYTQKHQAEKYRHLFDELLASEKNQNHTTDGALTALDQLYDAALGYSNRKAGESQEKEFDQCKKIEEAYIEVQKLGKVFSQTSVWTDPLGKYKKYKEIKKLFNKENEK